MSRQEDAAVVVARYIYEQVVDLLTPRGKHSQRYIARKVGCSRCTVAAIAADPIGFYQRHYSRRSREEGPFDMQSPPRRCQRCGRLVFQPCLACSLQGRGRGRNKLSHESMELKLELHDEQKQRLQEVRAARRKKAAQNRGLCRCSP